MIKAKSTKRILSGIVLYFNLLLLSVGASFGAPETPSSTNPFSSLDPLILLLGLGALLLIITLIITLVVIILSAQKNKKTSKKGIPTKSSLQNTGAKKTPVKAAIKAPVKISPPKIQQKSPSITTTPQQPTINNQPIVEEKPIIEKEPEIKFEKPVQPVQPIQPIIEKEPEIKFEKPVQPIIEESPFKLPTQSLNDIIGGSQPDLGLSKPEPIKKPVIEEKMDNQWDDIFGKSEQPVIKEEKMSGLFDSGKLDSDLDSLFTETSKPKVETPVIKEEKMSGLFDSGKLDSDLDSLFTEASKPKVETPVIKEDKKNSGLFDSGKLDSDLDSLFVEVNKPKVETPVVKEEKRSGLFDSGKLDSDLDSLFVEVNKPKVETPVVKEEKRSGLFDSSKLDSDLDSLFVEVSKPVEQKQEQIPSQPFDFGSDDLSSLFNAPTPIGKEDNQPKADGFSLDSFDFLATNDVKPESEKSSSNMDLGSLDFLVSDKEEEKNEDMGLPSINLSSFEESGVERPSIPFTKATKEDIENIDLSTTTMGLNISQFLSSIESNKKDKKEELLKEEMLTTEQPKEEIEVKFDMSSTLPPGTPTDFGLPEPQKEQELILTNEFKLDDTLPPQTINTSPVIPPQTLVVPPPPPPADTEKKKGRSDGIIAIGKMLVDQNALEEIIRKAEKGGKSGLTTTQVITAVKGRSLDTLLVDINNIDGIMGSIIVGKDGLVIANTMPPEIDKDLVGALTSSLFSNIDVQVKKLKKGPLKRLTAETDIGTYILTEIEMGTLVVFSQEDEKIDLNQVFKAITSVVGKR